MDNLYSTREAAAYLDIKLATLKHHLYVAKDLLPDGVIGKSLIFQRVTLDRFASLKRAPGRPRKL